MQTVILFNVLLLFMTFILCFYSYQLYLLKQACVQLKKHNVSLGDFIEYYSKTMDKKDPSK